MPVYEYRCDACNNQFELRQKFSDPPLDKCPQCGGAVHKMVSAASFSLKGGGWYGDGYGVKAEPAKPEGETAPVETGAAKEAASTETASPETAPAPAEKTATPAPQTPAPTHVETKSTAAETPATAKDKTEAK